MRRAGALLWIKLLRTQVIDWNIASKLLFTDSVALQLWLLLDALLVQLFLEMATDQTNTSTAILKNTGVESAAKAPEDQEQTKRHLTERGD